MILFVVVFLITIAKKFSILERNGSASLFNFPALVFQGIKDLFKSFILFTLEQAVREQTAGHGTFES